MYTRNDPVINFTGFLEKFSTPLNPSFKIIPKKVTSVTPKASIEITKITCSMYTHPPFTFCFFEYTYNPDKDTKTYSPMISNPQTKRIELEYPISLSKI